MKQLFLMGLLGLTFLTSCSKSDEIDEDMPDGDLSELIIGKWTAAGRTCNGGHTFRRDGTWSYGNFFDCEDICGFHDFGGPYSISGDILTATGGPGAGDSPNGRLVIADGSLKLYDIETGALILSAVPQTGCL